MSDCGHRLLMPYSAIVGQDSVKLALELSYVAPRLGGVLLSGERGTGKSTVVRAFARMMYGGLPVTIPINATEDRVVGGWKIDALMRNQPAKMAGLLKEADGKILYIDEVNLLDDHIVNIILDVASTGVLEIQRESWDEHEQTQFTLVGTMNPEEGGLRPQLLDRFALMVHVSAESNRRGEVLRRVLQFDAAVASDEPDGHAFFREFYQKDDERRKELLAAGRRNPSVDDTILDHCVGLAQKLGVDGHRGERVVLLAAKACAAIAKDRKVRKDHVRRVARMALQHRQRTYGDADQEAWDIEQEQILDSLLQ